MSILGIAFFAAIGYYIIVYKALGRRRLVKTQTFWDILFTLCLPILFIGTFSVFIALILYLIHVNNRNTIKLINLTSKM